mgnify:CR=1 FL=1
MIARRVRNGLRVAVREQALVDQALAQRIVEFEAGSAVLRPEGLKILDEMALALSQLQGKRIEDVKVVNTGGGAAALAALDLLVAMVRTGAFTAVSVRSVSDCSL